MVFMKNMVLIPVKKFKTAKSRLASVLKPTERLKLVQTMLFDVLLAVDKAKSEFDVAILTQDIDKVRRFLDEVKISKPLWLLEDETSSFNEAIQYVAEGAVRCMYEGLLVIPDDLPLLQPKDIDAIFKNAEHLSKCIVIAPSRTGGTNLLFLKPPNAITSNYGENSFERHKKEALNNRIRVIEYTSDTTDLDIDDVEDICILLQREHTKRKSRTHKFLKSLNFDFCT